MATDEQACIDLISYTSGNSMFIATPKIESSLLSDFGHWLVVKLITSSPSSCNYDSNSIYLLNTRMIPLIETNLYIYTAHFVMIEKLDHVAKGSCFELGV